MEKKKVNKTVTIVIAVAVILFILWFVIVYPLIDFNKKEQNVLDASKKYFEKNSNLVPDEGEMSTVTLRKLLSQKYVSTIKSTYGAEYCDVDHSWVKVKRKNGNYDYYVYLDCGKMKSSVDHDGPTISLKGKKELEIEKGSVYKDDGVGSIYDNTDGKMDIKDVKVEGKVNTKKIGTYTITYSAEDSFENKTVIERKVKVIQTLEKTVKQDTDKDNIYKGIDPNNYIEFSNMLFRIVGLNSDGTVRIVSSEPVGTVNYDDIDKWLNDYFYDHITSKAKKYIVKDSYCSGTVKESDVSKITSCKKSKKQNVGLLSISDYNKCIQDKNSYLYPNNMAWTSDKKSKNEAWTTKVYTSPDDKSNYLSLNKNYNFALYPAITLKKDIKLTSGNGSKASPYKFSSVASGKAGDKINTRYTGEYISYGNIKYRIMDGNVDGYAKVISIGNVIPSNESVGYTDSDKTKIYNPTQKGNVGYYIENELGKYIKKDIFVKRNVEVPIYDKIATYSGKKNTKQYKVTLAAPNMYEMFGATANNFNRGYWLINSSKEQYRKYLVSNVGVVYYDTLSDLTQTAVKVVGYVNKDATILSGKGTEDDPYVLTK